MPKIITTESFVDTAKKSHPHYDYAETTYVNAATQVSAICPKHGKFSKLPFTFLKYGCGECGREKGIAVRTYTQEEFVAACKQAHPDYDYTLTVFSGMRNKVRVVCPKHGVFEQIADVHLNKRLGCSKCGKDKLSQLFRMGADRFIERARLLHGDRYDYSKVVYTKNSAPVEIVCPVHQSFFQTPAHHLNGSGCDKCGGSATVTNSEFFKRSKRIHKHQYDYSATEFKGLKQSVTVVCKKHGPFTQSAQAHVSGHGCPKCGCDKLSVARTLPVKDYLRRARQVHGNKYEYPDLHTGQNTKVKIRCKKHNLIFEATWGNHTRNKSGCPKCANQISRKETEIGDWIESLGIKVERRDRTIIRPYEIDILVPSLKIAIEYNGIKWHSIPVSNRNNTKKTLTHYRKWKRCQNAGYQLFVIWESDYLSKPEVVKHWLKHKLGKSEKVCFARHCEIKEVQPDEAGKFYRAYHLQGNCTGGLHAGLYAGYNLVACMTFSKSVISRKRKAEEGEFFLTRFASSGNVPGAASRLFKRLCEKTEAITVLTYSDNGYAAGGIYEKLGFKEDGKVDPDYRVWHENFGIRHKSFWQRKSIPQRLKELKIDDNYDPETDPRSEFDICEKVGCLHLWDSGKIRWKWTKT